MNVESEDNQDIPMYRLQNADLLQADAIGAVTEGWDERSTDSMWVDQEWWMVLVDFGGRYGQLPCKVVDDPAVA